ncbi:glycerophosphodiester phosphodiesterase 1 [Orussus abietinus]|uniref:glycerophosphodiester phosphodiesterase 1 n=1 Tax=Orussus abietinus TaxID=222816 RepID=UPI000625B9F6|nr:glycerophosphodiester phosphodiesterase 1 [Orussus abietinus]
MHVYIEKILNCAVLCIYLRTIWLVVISILYEFTMPWIVWGMMIVMIGVKLARVPPPHPSIVQEVLGIDPFVSDTQTTNDVDHKSQGNGDGYCMRVVAHRGGGYDYPENSLSAFRNCKEKGCTAVELDISLTKDNVPIVFHDATIERLAGREGTVRDMTWEEIKEIDIAYTHPLRDKFGSSERILLLDDAIGICLQNGQHIIMDLKEKGPVMVQTILDFFSKYPELLRRAVVSSFDPIVVYMIRRKEPRIVCSLAWRPQYFSRQAYLGLDGPALPRFDNPLKHLMACLMDCIYGWAFPRFVYYIVGVSAVLLHKDMINPKVICQWKARGVRVMAWSVNQPSEKIHFSRRLRVTYLTDTLLAEKIS